MHLSELRHITSDLLVERKLAAIVQLRLPAADKRFRLTDTANRATLLRIIQSVPSPRAEPFRQWLAEVGDERFDEIEHPEAAIERVRQAYRDRGHDEAWIEARIRNDLTRNELTDEWQARAHCDLERHRRLERIRSRA